MLMLYPEPIGKITIITSYIYYDGDLLFSATDATGGRWLAVHCDIEEGGGRVWLFVQLSAERLADLDAGRIDFYDAFRHTENGDAWLVTDRPNGFGWSTTIRKLPASDVPEDQLPNPGALATDWVKCSA